MSPFCSSLQIVVEVHARLTRQGQRNLDGRLRSALTAKTGFAALYLEMDIARRLFDVGNDVTFPDLEGTGQYDVQFEGDGVSGEVECKSISAGAGRKIHRKDFYRFMDKVGAGLLARAGGGAREILLVTLSNRLPSEEARQQRLVAAIQQLSSNPCVGETSDTFSSISREVLPSAVEKAIRKGEREFYRTCRKLYGERIHAAGPILEAGCCLLIRRSTVEDDTSKPWLEAMQKAATRFSGARPAFIAVQFNDLDPNELLDAESAPSSGKFRRGSICETRCIARDRHFYQPISRTNAVRRRHPGASIWDFSFGWYVRSQSLQGFLQYVVR